MSYADDARALLAARIEVPDELLDLYALLLLVRGEATTTEHVHDAWSLWQSRTDPQHRSVRPFAELSAEVQAMDEPYAEAIRATARGR